MPLPSSGSRTGGLWGSSERRACVSQRGQLFHLLHMCCCDVGSFLAGSVQRMLCFSFSTKRRHATKSLVSARGDEACLY